MAKTAACRVGVGCIVHHEHEIPVCDGVFEAQLRWNSIKGSQRLTSNIYTHTRCLYNTLLLANGLVEPFWDFALLARHIRP